MTTPPRTDRDGPAPTYRLRDLLRYFLKLGAAGFGGPVALVGYMHRDLVDERRWISEESYKEGMALAQLAPGPLAAQLAMYLGFVHYRVRGATLAGLAFILPSFLMVVALGWAYTVYGGLPWMRSVFYGVGAAVIGLIVHSAYRLTRKTLGRDGILWAVYVAALVLTAVTEEENVLCFLAAGTLVWVLRAPPALLRGVGSGPAACLLPISMLPAAVAGPVDPTGRLWQIFLFFGKAGAFVFGSGLAIVPFLYGGVVKEHHWLNDRQFLDAVAVAMITPGPVVITVGFIGYLVAGFPGACIAALGTFLPCYLFTIVPAPYFAKHGKRPGIAAFVNGVTAAAIGAISGAVVVLGRRSITDTTTTVIAAVTLLLLVQPRRIPEPLLILAAALAGVLLA